jgi:hypothetical protein
MRFLQKRLLAVEKEETCSRKILTNDRILGGDPEVWHEFLLYPVGESIKILYYLAFHLSQYS